MVRTLIVLMLIAGNGPAFAQAPSVLHNRPKPVTVAAVDEVNIQQEKGRITTIKSPLKIDAPAKTPADAMTMAPAGSSSPTTCDPKNASSPSCYTATQQSRPITK
jgi:hypothetical protein